MQLWVPMVQGKSTLANVISGHEDYEITKGNIFFKDQEINEFSPEERAHERSVYVISISCRDSRSYSN